MLRISQNNSETPDHSLVSTAAANIYGSRGIRINLYCFGRRFNSLGSYRPGLLPTRRSEIALNTSHHCFSIRPARTRNVEANSSIACITPVTLRRVGDSRYLNTDASIAVRNKLQPIRWQWIALRTIDELWHRRCSIVICVFKLRICNSTDQRLP